MINLTPLSNDTLQPFAGWRRLLYGSQLVDLGLCLCFERSGGQNPDTAVAELNGSRTTTERDDPEPTEWPAKRDEGRVKLSISPPKPEQTGSVDGGGESVTTHLEKIQTSFATSRMMVSLMAVACGLLFVLRCFACRWTRLYTKL